MQETVYRLVRTLREVPDAELESFHEQGEEFRAYSLEDLRVILTKRGFAGLFFSAFGVEFFVTEEFEILFKSGDPYANDAFLLEVTSDLREALESYLRLRTFFLKKFSI